MVNATGSADIGNGGAKAMPVAVIAGGLIEICNTGVRPARAWTPGRTSRAFL